MADDLTVADMENLGATAEPVRIRIDYFNGIEETEAVHIGPFPDGGGEIFRVGRPSICIAGVAREDVVRLERVDDRYVFFGVIERSTWETHWLLLPREAVGAREAYDEFKQAIADAGCVLEGDRVDEEEPRVIISVPAGVAADRWTSAYERMIQRTAGLSPEALVARVGDDARRRDLAQRARREREHRARNRWQVLAKITRVTLPVLIGAVCIAVVGWWIHALVTASALTRPRVAALGMIIALLPGLFGSFLDRSIRPLMLGAAAAGVGALLLAGALSDPAYAFAAVALGLLFALIVGCIGVFFGIASVFDSSSRDRRLTWLLLVLPCLVSSIAAAVYALTAAHAAHIQFHAAQSIRMAGIVVTVLLLLVPLRTRTLRSIRAVLIPLAVVWLFVWLFGGLR
jgi:undecaprenyl pyrophosphate phosphatase UppP